MKTRYLSKICNSLLILALIGLGGAFPGRVNAAATAINCTPGQNNFCAFIPSVSVPPPPSISSVLMTGFIPSITSSAFMQQVDQWAGKKHSLVGLYYDFDSSGNPSADFGNELEQYYQAGYTAYVKIMASNHTAYQIAVGQIDGQILAYANAYKRFVDRGDGRKAFIAPLQEMNGSWVIYGGNPINFKFAYDQIQSIWQNAGVTRNLIWWAFSPNGWPDQAYDPNLFEYYYPGDAKVDVVGFSSYNYGYCLETWKSPSATYGSYIQRIQKMAPDKPIIVSETASSDYIKPGVRDHAAKNQWLIDSYAYLSTQTGVVGVLYFDIEPVEHNVTCNLRVYNYPTIADRFDGYQTAVSNSKYSYVSPLTLSRVTFVLP
jgi:Glycosyl hydrolase family 26